MPEIYDAIIVGLGPAGSNTALELARAVGPGHRSGAFPAIQTLPLFLRPWIQEQARIYEGGIRKEGKR